MEVPAATPVTIPVPLPAVAMPVLPLLQVPPVPLLLIVPVALDMTGAALAVGEKEIRAMLDEAVARIERKEDLITLMNGFFIETP